MSTDLVNRTIVVAGATGGVGEGVVRALLARGATVIAVGRSRQRLDDLAGRVRAGKGSLILLEGDVGAPESAALTARLRSTAGGSVDGAVISIGRTPPARPGTVLDIPDGEVLAAIEQNEIAGVRALRALVPIVRTEGAVVDLMGFSAEIPFPGNPLMGSTNAAIRSIVRTLAVQLAGSGPRVYALLLGVVRTRARQTAGVDDPRWLTGDHVGDAAADLVLGRVQEPATTVRYLLDPARGPMLTAP